MIGAYWSESIEALRHPFRASVRRSGEGSGQLELLLVVLIVVVLAEVAAQFVHQGEVRDVFREILPVRRGYSANLVPSSLDLFLLTVTWIMIVMYAGPWLAHVIALRFGGVSTMERANSWLFLYMIILIPFHFVHIFLVMSAQFIENMIGVERWILSVVLGVSLKLLIMFYQAVFAMGAFGIKAFRQGLIVVFVWEVATGVLLTVRGAALYSVNGATQ